MKIGSINTNSDAMCLLEIQLKIALGHRDIAQQRNRFQGFPL